MEPVIRMEGITKIFSSTVANDGINFDIYPAEIHALLGENGAGKTTLMNILYGLYRPDKGSILVNGKKVNIRNSLDAQRYGIGMVHQHFSQIPSFTVLENISIGLKEGHVRLNLKEIRERVTKAMKEYNITVDLNKRMEEFTVGEIQRAEILKMLFRGANILLLDEPTSSLTPQESEDLFDSLRSLIKAGKSVVLITHKLYEVFEVADRITVLRKGRITYEGLRSETTNEKVVEAMIGKEVDLVNFQRGEKKFEGSMRAEGLAVYQEGVIRVDNVSFELNRGEILGIAAVAGNGEKELVEALFGLRKLASGKIYLEKEQIDGLSVKGRIRLGLGYIPEERLTRGVARGISLSLNSINHDHWWEPYTKNELLNFKEIREFATRIVKQFNVDSRSEEERVQNLSGGNIQKFIVGRELLRNPKYMIVVNPTAGLDVGATEGFRRYLMEFRNAGRGILLNSEDLDELLSLSDRIMVMHKGRIVGAFNRDKFDKLKIGALMLGKDIGG